MAISDLLGKLGKLKDDLLSKTTVDERLTGLLEDPVRYYNDPTYNNGINMVAKPTRLAQTFAPIVKPQTVGDFGTGLAKNLLSTSTFGIVNPWGNYTPQTTAGKVGSAIGFGAGFLNNPLGAGLNSFNVGGKVVGAVAPKAVGLAPRIAGGLISEAAQTGALAVGSKLGNMVGLNDTTNQFDPKNLLTEAGIGSAMRGVTSPGALGAISKGVSNIAKKFDSQILSDQSAKTLARIADRNAGGVWEIKDQQQLDSLAKEYLKLPKNVLKTLKKDDIIDQLNTLMTKNQEYVYRELPGYRMGFVQDQPVPQKIRGFAKTVAESDVPKEIRDFAKTQTYEPLQNSEVLKTVSKITKQGDSQAIAFAKTDATVNGNATAMVMIRKLIDKGRFDEANDLIRAVSPRFTQQGQQIQILAQFGRLKPEGAVRYAQNLIDKANQANPNLKLKLTPENTQLIVERAKAIENMADGSREKIVATAQLMQSIGQVVPPSIGQKIATVQTMAQLLNPKTAIRNTLGNTLFAGVENVSDVVGTGLDKATSLFTGQRTKGLPEVGAQVSGVKKGLAEGLQDAKLGIDTSGGVSSQFDLPTKTFTKGVLGKLETLLNIELRATDRAAYTGAFEGSLANQMKVAGVTKPTDQMLQVAHADALYRTFQDDSKLAQLFTGAKRSLNKIGFKDGSFGLGDFVLKYPKTPANILSRALDYSPAGFAKGLYEASRPLIAGEQFNQKAFIEAMSRGLVGTGLVTAGYILADNGVLSGSGEKDYDLRSLQDMSGGARFKLNVDALKRFALSGGQPQKAENGDQLVSYDWAQPNALQFAMGANMAKASDPKKALDSIVESLDAGVQTLTDQPLVKNLTDIPKNIEREGFGGAATQLVGNTVSGFIPSIVRQIANLTDTTRRETYSPDTIQEIKNKMIASVPGARESLLPRIDQFGREMPNYDNPNPIGRAFDIFLNPAFVTTVKQDPVVKEVLDIYSNTGETTQVPRVAPKSAKINGIQRPLTAQEYKDYQTYIGQQTNQYFNNMLSDPGFSRASDVQKAKIMQNALTDIASAGRILVLGNQPKTTTTGARKVMAGDTKVSTYTDNKGNLKIATKAYSKRGKLRVSPTKSKSIRVPKAERIARKLKLPKVKALRIKAPKVKRIKLAKLQKKLLALSTA